MKRELETGKFYLVGNNLSVDFVNTEIVENGEPKNLLEDFTDLAAWATATGLLEKSRAKILIDDWTNSAEIEKAFTEAINFRARLRAMFAGLQNGKPIEKSTLAAINREIQNTGGAVEIKETENGFEKLFRADFQKPHQLLAPVAESAADLLCYANPSHIKKCEGAECVLYFYDTTKNHSRRWCSMAACGNRHKAAAFYRRAKTGAGGKKKRE